MDYSLWSNPTRWRTREMVVTCERWITGKIVILVKYGKSSVNAFLPHHIQESYTLKNGPVFWPTLYIEIFMNMTSLLWRHVYLERSQLVQYFTHSFTTCQVLKNVIASYEYQKNECIQQWNLFKCQTSTFYLST